MMRLRTIAVAAVTALSLTTTLAPAHAEAQAAWAAPGKSVLRDVYNINRGYEDIANRLNSLGADIETVWE